MNDKLKLRLADIVLDFLHANQSAADNSNTLSVAVGTLNKPWGLNGFKGVQEVFFVRKRGVDGRFCAK